MAFTVIVEIEPVASAQISLDRFLRYYNLERSHQGFRLRGRTQLSRW